MTVADLIAELQKMPQEAEVVAYDDDDHVVVLAKDGWSNVGETRIPSGI